MLSSRCSTPRRLCLVRKEGRRGGDRRSTMFLQHSPRRRLRGSEIPVKDGGVEGRPGVDAGEGKKKEEDVIARRWILYRAACALRFACVFLPGYIHPDEFFQSTEVAASDMFALGAAPPWEFNPSFPCRSSLVPLLTARAPYNLLLLLPRPSSSLFLYAPRIAAFASSFLLDASLLHIAPSLRACPSTALLTLSSSWPVLLMSTRPFSNSLESVILALFLALYISPPRCLPPPISAIAAGILLSVGIFIRFTLVFFVAPPLLLLLLPSPPSPKPRLPIIPLVFGALASAAACVTIDTAYFGSSPGSKPVFAPWNSIVYNSKAENLADHGLHPRATHLLVNLPLLYGPVYIALLYRLSRFLPGLTTYITRLASASSPLPSDLAAFCLTSSCIFGVACLSAAPHQEPRFLIPLTVPICLLSHGPPGPGTSRWLLWAVSNAIPLIFFGSLHQAGVTTAAQWLSRARPAGGGVVWWKTYMPPSVSLLQAPLAAGELGATDRRWRSVDLKGGSGGGIREALAGVSVGGEGFVVAPATVDAKRFIPQGCRVVRRVFPHLTMEDPPWEGGVLGNFMERLSLEVWQCGGQVDGAWTWFGWGSEGGSAISSFFGFADWLVG